MKKYLMTGMAAIAFCAAFTSCSKDENLYDICRGHDLLKLLSLTLVDVQTYSVDALMAKMTEAYSLDDFKTTKLYSSIKTWQATEGTPVIRYVF